MQIYDFISIYKCNNLVQHNYDSAYYSDDTISVIVRFCLITVTCATHCKATGVGGLQSCICLVHKYSPFLVPYYPALKRLIDHSIKHCRTKIVFHLPQPHWFQGLINATITVSSYISPIHVLRVHHFKVYITENLFLFMKD